VKLAVRPENPMERLAMALGLAPVTLVDTHMAFLRARAIMAATKLGMFEALARGPLPADDIAAQCGTAPAASASLLNALVGSGYLRFRAGRYALAPVARKWLLAGVPQSVRDKVLFEFFEWSIVEGLEDFVRTGRACDLHQRSSREQWAAYQRAMRALSGIAAPAIVRRTPMPSNPAAMLDIGGSHGFISVAMCRRYPSLRAVVLDLPAAIEHAAPILARENMGERVVHRSGNALEDDLGDAQWDFVYMAQLVHHFDGSTNRALMRRVARALKPGGIVCVVELIRPESPAATGQVGALLDLYFALTSQAGTWSIEEMTAWQREAGLVPLRPIHLRTVPGAAAITARRDRP
jgi:ubiquinone/menaquinone biosynthesis C-methylase UbiE